jgi:hypothetical protein
MLVKAADLNVPGAASYFRELLGNGPSQLVTSVDPQAVARFCRVDGTVLAHASPVFDRNFVTLMGQRFKRRDYATTERRWCPLCLAENGSHRTWWDLTHVTSCTRHHTVLRDACICGKKTRWARSASLVACSCGRWLKDAPPNRPDWMDSAFDDYLVARLLGNPRQEVQWLDALEMHDVIDTVRIVGDFVLDPFEEKGLGNSVDGRHRLMAAGFRTIVDFPRPIETMLADVYRDRLDMLRPPHRMHSREFRVWLATGKDTPMKKAIRRAVRKWTIRFAPKIGDDDIPFGYFTLRHAGDLCGYNPEALRVVLRLKRPKAWSKHVEMPRVDPETMAWLVRHVYGSIGEGELASLLDVEFREISPLRSSGHIGTFVQATGAAYSFFSPDEADRLVRRLSKFWKGRHASCTAVLGLPKVARELDTPVTGLVSAILDRRLEVSGIAPEARGLSQILVDVEKATALSLTRWEDRGEN